MARELITLIKQPIRVIVSDVSLALKRRIRGFEPPHAVFLAYDAAEAGTFVTTYDPRIVRMSPPRANTGVTQRTLSRS
jgi:hypothetical protein